MKKLIIAMMLLAIVPALADDSQPVTNNQPMAEKNDSELKKTENYSYKNTNANPLISEINQIHAIAMARLVDLNDQLLSQNNNAGNLELVREIEQVKQTLELDILRLQASAALARGDHETANELNNAIDEMTTPRPPRPAVERPAPGHARN